ncbi:hypothetical protein BGZ47_004991, partial [Haplosporangium gracile]
QGIGARSFFEQVLHKNPNVRCDTQQAMAHAFLEAGQEGEEQGVEDNAGSLLSKRPSEVVLDERERKRACQDTHDCKSQDKDLQTALHASTLPATTAPKATAPI